jgi:hypothetical protein
MSAFPHDPELEPIAAGPGAPTVKAEPVATQRPIVRPADPDRWSATLSLDHPLLVDDARLDTLTVKALTGRAFVDLVMQADGDEDRLVRLVRATMCGVHPDVLDALHADDHARVVASCRPFLPRPLRVAPDPDDLVAGATAALDQQD